ncbi:PASTA domain-containing protein [Chryseobacterium chendengshani]|uniref:PASTA domain-containing protein n=1 Tax=unclassified Chryseobacterium TaxID=2593645 RepID=UPI001C643ADB|nr:MULTISPECIES: PASTA domain-containing protein [unclassified Chryseobacterium]MBW7676097.1 PASTA domain-containing protein [Chryseobacterium sp. LJ756]MBW8524299.1 PASTA domain-containing protein [Chryseobacterium sp. LJ668]QYK17225.1 PASTA domain-containing protein [Chryseobacterium sp. LJ668]
MLKSLFNWKVLINLVVAVAVFMGLVWLTFRWLEYHTNHGQEIPVPNVVNKSVHDAVKILEDTGLDYEVDSATYNPKYRPFQVLQVYPSPGSRVKDGRAIQLKVNPRSWAPVAVPDVINKYSGLAFQRLDQVGLKVGDTIFEPSIQKDAVLRVLFKGNTIKPGSLIPRFSIIDVVIGSGPMRNITIPNVVGLTVKEAKAYIARNLFEVGVVEHEDGSSDESDIVYYQDPAAGDARDQGMQIDLWASKKTPAELRGRIDQLNSIYRMQVDTTLPPIRYEEVPNFQDAPVNETPPPVTPKREVPKTETLKPSGTSTSKPVGTAKATDVKPKTSSADNTGKQTVTPTEKPKAKKAIIN